MEERNKEESGYPHLPVMVREVLEGLDPQPGQRFLDCTVGAGGHAEKILERILPGGYLIGCDRDPEILGIAQKRLEPFAGSWELRNLEFSQFSGEQKFDGILADLGVSSLQLDDPERGFSFRGDGPLDMRMNRDRGVTAAEIIKRANEKQLADMIYQYGGEGRSRRISRFIVEARRRQKIESTDQLAQIVARALGRRGRIHPATKVFQALRIAVNQELDNLEAFLAGALNLLKKGGRIGIISFHSLEDRLVKVAFRSWERELAAARIITKKPLRPQEQEVRNNPRARSARLRIAQKI